MLARWPTGYWGRAPGQRLTRHPPAVPASAPAVAQDDGQFLEQAPDQVLVGERAQRSSPALPTETRRTTVPGEAQCGHLFDPNEHAVINRSLPGATRTPLWPGGTAIACC